jgi:hypothetical protein
MDGRDEKYQQRENLWDEQWPESGTESAGHGAVELDTENELAPFPGVVGTSDVIESVRDAEPYVPAMDPPVLPGGREGIHVATGFGTDPLEEASQDALPRGDEDIRQQVTLALRQDSLTSKYPLHVHVRDGVVLLRGEVQSVEDAEHAQWLIGELSGVVDVVDETTVSPTGD